jgi:hypothetical protein
VKLHRGGLIDQSLLLIFIERMSMSIHGMEKGDERAAARVTALESQESSRKFRRPGEVLLSSGQKGIAIP